MEDYFNMAMYYFLLSIVVTIALTATTTSGLFTLTNQNPNITLTDTNASVFTYDGLTTEINEVNTAFSTFADATAQSSPNPITVFTTGAGAFLTGVKSLFTGMISIAAVWHELGIGLSNLIAPNNAAILLIATVVGVILGFINLVGMIYLMFRVAGIFRGGS